MSWKRPRCDDDNDDDDTTSNFRVLYPGERVCSHSVWLGVGGKRAGHGCHGWLPFDYVGVSAVYSSSEGVYVFVVSAATYERDVQ